MANQPMMNPAAQTASIYERQRIATCAHLARFYSGSLNALFCVVSSNQPTESARKALEATAQRGGFSAQHIIWVTTNAVLDDEVERSSSSLEPTDLMKLIESIDPLCVVALDQRAVEVLSRAYNQPIKLESGDSLLGRPCCAFVDFARMLQTDERKQNAWALLKDLLAHVNDF